MQLEIKIGSKVTFDNDKYELFISEMNSDNPAVKEYLHLVMSGINQVGIVEELDVTFATVLFADGWKLPIPKKYLFVLPENDIPN